MLETYVVRQEKQILTVNLLENSIAFKILVDNIVVGDIIISDRQNGYYHLGGLCVIPEYENRGIGQKAIEFLDSYFQDARHWSYE